MPAHNIAHCNTARRNRETPARVYVPRIARLINARPEFACVLSPNVTPVTATREIRKRSRPRGTHSRFVSDFPMRIFRGDTPRYCFPRENSSRRSHLHPVRSSFTFPRIILDPISRNANADRMHVQLSPVSIILLFCCVI